MRSPLALLPLLALAAGCATAPAPPAWPTAPVAGASEAFWAAWGDGKAEVATYAATVARYDTLRPASVVLITVTEPMSRRTWIKDDRAEGDDRVDVLKVNQMATFQTGVYPYSVMTSTFMPVADFGPRVGGRFAPAKITLTAQEWCGHVWHGVWPGIGGFRSSLRSYFAEEGETDRAAAVPEGTLYEDALAAQLRELDGPFHGGRDWRGSLVPTLWHQRVAHDTLAAVDATIARADTSVAGPEGGAIAATRFRIAYHAGRGPFVRTLVVERAAPHRILGWSTSLGERGRLIRAVRMPYWQLNRGGDERWRDSLGLAPLPVLAAP